MSPRGILWVKIGGLWPANTGGRLRSFHIVSELARRHRVTVLTTHGPDDDVPGLRRRLAHCEKVVSVPYVLPRHGSARFAAALLRSWLSPLPVDLWKTRVPALQHHVRQALAVGGIDLCVADFLVATPNVPARPPVPVVFFAHNVEHMIWRRLWEVERRPLRRLLLDVERRKMRRAERRTCAQASLTVAVSTADRDQFAAEAPGARITAIPTGVDTEYFTPTGAAAVPGRLVFTGSMDWYPNEDGILHFIDAVLPAVRRAMPGVSLAVVGRKPSERLRSAAVAAGVEVTGGVDDIRPHIEAGEVYVVPLRVGGGTRIKIFEALAMGRALVSTTVGAEGLPLEPGRHFLQEDDPAAFASAVIALLRDPARRAALGAAGRRLVTERYSWAQVARDFERCCELALAAPRPAALGAPVRV